ncbi:MAG TPA: hypothetical protein VH158_10275 [Gemmatimonadales bacterium]|nr:hypothetical protein [Gemmatimonadales bacterium]
MRVFALTVAALATGTALQAQRSQKNLITVEELSKAQANMSTAYDAVAMLRPRWLEAHELARLPGTRTESLRDTPIRVYLNEVNMGDAEYLKTIPVANVRELRWLSANEAASRYGPTDGQSAIVVTLKAH